MTVVLAYLALVLAVAAVLCGHQSQPFPPWRWWRRARARRRARRCAWAHSYRRRSLARRVRRGRDWFREAA